MLRRLFVKETFEHIEEELNAIYQVFGIEPHLLKIKKQPATYSKPYTHVVEGNIEKHRFVLSLHQSPLKVQALKQELGLIIQCENPNWMTLVLQKKNGLGSTSKKALGVELISPLENINLDKILIESSDEERTKGLFDLSMGNKIALIDGIQFSSFVLERKRLYVELSWLPDNFSKRQAFIKLLDFSINLVKKIDAQE